MAVPTYQQFLERFTEFNEFHIPAESVTDCITAASKRVNPSAWGDQEYDAVMYLAAHLLVQQHRVKCCKLINKDNSTGYQAEYLDMRGSIISGDRVP